MNTSLYFTAKSAHAVRVERACACACAHKISCVYMTSRKFPHGKRQPPIRVLWRRAMACVYIVYKNSSNYNVEYRDGIKSRRDKIGMPCTHTTVI